MVKAPARHYTILCDVAGTPLSRSALVSPFGLMPQPAWTLITVFVTCCAILTARGQPLPKTISEKCQTTLSNLGKHHPVGDVILNPDHMLYFLHIPRTAGRTYGACFLKQAWAPSRRCAKSYDVLRLNESVPDCGLLSSHDDYSVLQFLPEDAAIATQLRDPVDRVLSMYEFAIEVAAKYLNPNATQRDPGKMDTRKVWPWSILAQFMQQELEESATSRHDEEDRDTTPVDPYNNKFVISLTDFIEHPLAYELVHNGQTLQVLGVTNYSHWKLAGPVRQCLHAEAPSSVQQLLLGLHEEAASASTTQQLLLSLALKQLPRFVHVGIMELLDESIETFAATLKLQLGGPAWRNKPNTTAQSDEAAERADEQAFLEQPSSRLNQQQAEPDSAYLQEAPLWAAYRLCAARARKANAARTAHSVALLTASYGQKLVFGREARANIDPTIIDRIRELNSMDAILYQVGKRQLLRRREDLHAAHRVERLPQLPARHQTHQPHKRPAGTSNSESAGGAGTDRSRDEL